MKYKRFIIENYRGIIEPLEIKIKQGRPIALVGLNESGKSTILDAIFAFDYQNDNLNKKYKQLNDTKNLYARPSEQKDSKISAFIVFDDADFDFLTGLFTTMHLFNTSSELLEGLSDDEINEKRINIIKNFLYSGVLLTRTIKSETVSSYEIEVNEDIESNKHFNIENLKTKSDEFAKKLIEYLPTMVYVMEFDTFLEEITLKPTPEQIQAEKEYRELYNNLFLAATNNYMGLDEFAKMTDARDYGPILEDVIKFLNEEFTKRWEKFSIDHNFSKLTLDLLVQQSGKLKIVVYEEINGKKFSFNISNRSSGFKWYFNFIMRTMFNPIHKNSNNRNTFYLMDEPGTFLHETSQKSLATELKDIIGDNFLIYTTHHFQMLNLTNISLNNIYIVEKHNKLIKAYKTTDYQGYDNDAKKAVVLPILHTLRFTFLDMLRNDENKDKKFLIVEGLHDYYFIKLFILDNKLSNLIVWPSVGASQIIVNLPEFRFYNKGVYALLDNDKAGVDALNNYIKAMGQTNSVFVLPFEGYNEDSSKSFTMNNMIPTDVLNEMYEILIKARVPDVYNNYKSIMENLFENEELIIQLKSNTEFKNNIRTLKKFLIDKIN